MACWIDRTWVTSDWIETCAPEGDWESVKATSTPSTEVAKNSVIRGKS